MDKMPATLINYRAYLGSTPLPGTADVTLPDLEALTSELKGAGIAGTIDMPIPGHFGAMSATINFRTIAAAQATLSNPEAQMLTFRGAQMVFNPDTGKNESQRVAVTIKGMPKKDGLGKLEAGSTTDSSIEMEVLYIKVVLDNEVIREIDKLNYICRINGVDVLAGVRSALGIEAADVGVTVPVRI